MKKYIIVVVMLLTALLLCGCNGELSDLMDMPFNEESEIVLVIGKYDGDKFPIEEGVCFYAFDKHNTAYKVVWSDTGELLENSVVIVSYTKMNKPEVSENEGFADAEYEIIATSVRYTDDELAAKTVIEKKYTPKHLSEYKMKIETNEDGTRTVKYYLCFGKYDSGAGYTVKLGQATEILMYYESGKGYEKYIGHVSDEAIRVAEEKLAEIDDGSPYITIDQEGYLCLAKEVIVPIDPTDENEEPAGCGDHRHVFYIERISDRAFK